MPSRSCNGSQMGTAALLLLTVLAVQHSSAAAADASPGDTSPDASPDCNVLITGTEQQWTPSRCLRKVRSVATSAKLQLVEPLPERREVAFGVRSAAVGLQLLLYAELTPGGTLLTLDADGWRVHLTQSGKPDVLMASGEPPAGPVLTADDWVSYSVSVEPDARATLRLHRLYDNGTRALWLEVPLLVDTTTLLVDTVKVRAVTSDTNCAGRGNDNGGLPGGWSLWAFDILYQKAGLCQVRPSPRLADSSGGGVTLQVGGSGSLQLQLFGTSRRFYLVTLTPSELTLGRVELGVPAARQVARRCRSASAGQVGHSVTVQLYLVDHSSEERPGPAGGMGPCQRRDPQGLGTAETPEEGSGLEEEGSADQGWQLESSAMGEPYSDEPVTVGFLTLGESAEAEAEEMADIHEMTAMELYPATVMLEKAVEGPAAAHEMSMTALTEVARSTARPELEGTSIIGWSDGQAFYQIGQLTSRDEQAAWTSDCPAASDVTTEAMKEVVSSTAGYFSPLLGGSPDDESAIGDDKLSRSSDVGIFQSEVPVKVGDRSTSSGAGSTTWPPRQVLVTVVLSTVCLLLLITTLALASLLLGRRRRQRASFSPDKADLFGAPNDAGFELAESHPHDSVLHRSVVNQNHGVSTFKPVRRQAAAVTVAVPELPLPPPPTGTQETSLDLPPPPPLDSLETPQPTREGTPPLPPLPAVQRTSVLPPQPDQLLPPLSPDVALDQLQYPLMSPGVVLEQLQPLQGPLPPPPPPPAELLFTPADQLLPPPADQPLTAGGPGVSQLPPPPDDM